MRLLTMRLLSPYAKFFLAFVLVLSACTAPPVPLPPIPSSPLPPSPVPPSPPLSVDDLSAILWASDPGLPQYDPKSAAYAAFPQAVQQLAGMGPGAVDAADDLAVAIRYPRPNSYLAAQALLALGPDITSTLLPLLIDNLHHPKPDVRIYSVILIGIVGKNASCAVGNIGPLLWDPDPSVRTAAALALDKSLEKKLLDAQYEIAISPAFLAESVPADSPAGSIVGTAQKWWTEQGSRVNWHPSYGLCDP
jgi:hypothetical protein